MKSIKHNQLVNNELPHRNAMTNVMQPKEYTYIEVLGHIDLNEQHIQQTFDYYHERYLSSELAQEFVNNMEEVIENIHANKYVGFCDRTMGKQIPPRRSFEGGSIRGSLQRCGLVRPTGHELFRGCVVFPSFDDQHRIISASGYRIAPRIRNWDEPIVYWSKPEPNNFKELAMNKAKDIIHAKAYH
jgi:hypothetical protein